MTPITNHGAHAFKTKKSTAKKTIPKKVAQKKVASKKSSKKTSKVPKVNKTKRK